MHKCECRTGYRFGNAVTTTYRLNQRGFSRTELAGDRDP